MRTHNERMANATAGNGRRTSSEILRDISFDIYYRQYSDGEVTTWFILGMDIGDTYLPTFIGGVRTPAQGGPPQGSLWFPDGRGGGTRRFYDDYGWATKDVDYGHNHGAGDPHVHDWDWDWTKSPPRQPGRAPRPGEPLTNRDYGIADYGLPWGGHMDPRTIPRYPYYPGRIPIMPINPVIPPMPIMPAPVGVPVFVFP